MLMIRKTLAVCCVTVSVMIGGFLDYIAYMIAASLIDSKLAMLVFIPFFIVMYWLGTFYEQLIIMDGKALFHKKIRIALRAVYTVSVLTVCAVWLWVIYEYTYFFGNIIGSIRAYLS